MDETHELLTEERIRALVRDGAAVYRTIRGGRQARFDAAVASTAGDFLADSTHLLFILGALEKGTIQDAITAHRQRMARVDTTRLDPQMAAMMRGNARIHEAQLAAIDQREVEAVIACLDEIATLYPAQAEAVRLRHSAAHRATRMEAAQAVRTGDPSRPQLTADRVRRLLDVIDAIVPGPKMVVRALNEGGFVLESQAATKMFPATTVKKIKAQGEDPAEFARDYAWMRIISDHIGRGDTIDERLLAVIPYQSADAWVIAAHPPAYGRQRAERFAAAMHRPLELLSRVGREEEAAVKSVLDEIQTRLRAARELQARTNAGKRKQQKGKIQPEVRPLTAIAYWVLPGDDDVPG